MAEIDDLREEVAFWRKNAVAIIWGSACMMASKRAAGELDQALDIKVNRIWPLRATLAAADAKQWHSGCIGCDGPLISGQIVLTYDEGERCHLRCEDVDFKPDGNLVGEDDQFLEVYDDGFGAADIEKMLAFAAEEERLLDEAFGG